MKKMMRSPIVWIVLGLVALDVVLRLLAPRVHLETSVPYQSVLPVQSVPASVPGIIGGMLVLGVIFAFFYGMSLTFRAHRSFHARMKRDGIWKRSR